MDTDAKRMRGDGRLYDQPQESEGLDRIVSFIEAGRFRPAPRAKAS
jgi:hypothetical protein